MNDDGSMQNTLERQEGLQKQAPTASNSISTAYAAVAKLGEAKAAELLSGLWILGMVYTDEVAAATDNIQDNIGKPGHPRRVASCNAALDEIRAVLVRPESFTNPFKPGADDKVLVADALEAIYQARMGCGTADVRTPKLRQALRFLTLKAGNNKLFADFWNEISKDGHPNSRYATATSIYNGIVRIFPDQTAK